MRTLRVLSIIGLLACALASATAPAGEPVSVSQKFVLYHDDPGGFGCAPDQDISFRTMCIRVPAGARTVDMRVEPLVPTGTPADAALSAVGVRYGADYSPGPAGEFCGSVDGASLVREPPFGGRILILAFAGPMNGPRICGFPPNPSPGIAIAGVLVATFHFG